MDTPVLVVDDDASLRASVGWLLTDEGFTVLEAADGRAALDLLRAQAEGMVVLLDIKMPVMDGFAVVQAIEDEPPLATKHAYIVLSATHRTVPLPFTLQLTRLGIPVIHKPFDIDALLDAVAAAAARLHH